MRYFIVLMTFMVSLASMAQKSGVHVGNAGGFSEYNLQIAYQSYGQWLQHLLAYDKSVTVSEMSLLGKLLKASSQETGGLIFSDSHEALTFSEAAVGSPIYVHPKILQQQTDILKRDLLLSEAYVIIVKQIGQHIIDPQDFLNQTALLSLAGKIETAAQQSIISTTAAIKNKDLIKSYSWSNLLKRGQLILTSANAEAIDITNNVSHEADCADVSLDSLTILEPSFTIVPQGHDDFSVEMNFYIKVVCDGDHYLKDVTARFFINDQEFKFVSMESRLLF